MIQCVIFDLDGTLIDTLEDLMDATNEVLAGKGYPIRNLDEIRAMVGHGGFKLLQRALPAGKNSDLETEEAFTAFKAAYHRRLTNKTRPYSGIEALLAELETKGIQVAVHTNKPQEAATEIVQSLFPQVNFIDIVGYRSEETKKPNPYFTLEIAKHAQVEPESCLFVGDSRTDFHTGKNAGMKPILVTWGFRDRAHLSQESEAVLIDEPKELLTYL